MKAMSWIIRLVLLAACVAGVYYAYTGYNWLQGRLKATNAELVATQDKLVTAQAKISNNASQLRAMCHSSQVALTRLTAIRGESPAKAADILNALRLTQTYCANLDADMGVDAMAAPAPAKPAATATPAAKAAKPAAAVTTKVEMPADPSVEVPAPEAK